MAYPVLIKLFLKGKEISGPTNAFGVHGAWEGHEFSHRVHAWEHNNGWKIKWMHAHHPLSVVLEVGSFLPELYRTIARGEKLDRVELHWPQYRQTDNAERIYFKTRLHPVKISSIRQFYPNIAYYRGIRHPIIVLFGTLGLRCPAPRNRFIRHLFAGFDNWVPNGNTSSRTAR